MKTVKDNTEGLLKSLTQKQRGDATTALRQTAPFDANGNVPMTDIMKAIMTEQVASQLNNVFKIMKLDINDDNLIDTPFRIASMWVNELMGGRYEEAPRIASFKNKLKLDCLE